MKRFIFITNGSTSLHNGMVIVYGDDTSFFVNSKSMVG
jgi:hypothetical protein